MAKKLHPSLRNALDTERDDAAAYAENTRRTQVARASENKAQKERLKRLIKLADVVAEKAVDKNIPPNITVVRAGVTQAIGWRVLTHLTYHCDVVRDASGGVILNSDGKAQGASWTTWDSVMLRRDGLLVAYGLPKNTGPRPDIERGGEDTTAAYVPVFKGYWRATLDMQTPGVDVTENPVTKIQKGVDYPLPTYANPKGIERGLIDLVVMHDLGV